MMMMTMATRVTAAVALMSVTMLMPACRSAYYGTMEAFGHHKRDILVDRVEEARNDQQKAKEQFRDALEAFNAVVNVPPSELRDTYERLNAEHKRSQSRAEDVQTRIRKVDEVAKDLFKEWETEIDTYTNENLRRRSEDQLRDTRFRYEQLYRAMTRAESKMQPVLNAFSDQVLFLKHNLNAQAVASLQGEVDHLETEIAELIRDMESAIAEADSFINAMSSE
ncbi:MAG: DUF2959 domain-containing protein [Phycisphaerales bacterium]